MKTKFILLILFAFLITEICFSQSIRKDYREMSSQERQAYVNALHELWSDGTIQSFANIHANNMGVAHGNERFLPWHRIFIKQLEEELQSHNSQIAIPYWNWPEDNSFNPAWNEFTFLGQFDSLWILGRDLDAAGSLPTQNQVNTVQSLSHFSTGGVLNRGYGGSVNGGGDLEVIIHNPPHVWVGGVMNGPQSPRDPIFYFHHSMVDKLWQDWGGQSVFSSNSLNFSPYGMLNPHDYVDSRSLNVWYAQDGVVLLDQYETSGTNYYRYTGKIESEDFTVASGGNVTFTAGAAIELGPGFKTETGSTFYAEVDAGVGNILSRVEEDDAIAEELLQKVHDTETPANWSLSQNYPNPFNPQTTINYSVPHQAHVRITVYNISGQRVRKLVDKVHNSGAYSVQFDASHLASGMYLYRIQADSFVQTHRMMLIK